MLFDGSEEGLKSGATMGPQQRKPSMYEIFLCPITIASDFCGSFRIKQHSLHSSIYLPREA